MLDHASAWRVYLGGRSIRALRGERAPVDDHFPEEWIASTVEAAGAGALPGAGLSRLRSRALNHGCGWWTMPTNSGRPSVPVMANTKGRFKTKSTSSSGGAAAPHIIMTV